MSKITLEGWVSVRAALVSGSRTVHEILLQRGKDSNKIDVLKKRAREGDIPVRFVHEDEISKHAEGTSHGGVLAFVGERNFLALDDLSNGPQAAFLTMLDGVEDPYNFGQAVRALYACGAHGLIVRPRNWTTAASTVARASAGTSEFMRMAVAESDTELLSMLKKQNIQLVCSDLSDTAKNPSHANLRSSLLLVIGGERRGISKELLSAADVTLQIPYGRAFKQSLGVTSSAAILAYEVMQQRNSSTRASSKPQKTSAKLTRQIKQKFSVSKKEKTES